MGNEEETLKQLNKSGFPLQSVLSLDVSSTTADHGWSVASRDIPGNQLSQIAGLEKRVATEWKTAKMSRAN